MKERIEEDIELNFCDGRKKRSFVNFTPCE